VAAGIRRIEAKTGKECEELIYNTEDSLRAVRAFFNNAKDLQGVIAKYIEEHDAMKKDIEQYQAQRVQNLAVELVAKARLVNGVKLIADQRAMMPNAAKDLVFKIREMMTESFVCVVGSVFDGKPMLNVMLSDDMVKDHGLNAGQLVREAAKLMQGGGGGQPHYASAGGKNPDGLSAAIDKVVELASL
jgi:alanyl-tRNA synthetase